MNTTEGAPISVLCLNAGSSSLKAARYRADLGVRPVLERRVLVEDVGGERARTVAWDAAGEVVHERSGSVLDHLAALRSVQDATSSLGPADVIAHRIVHGGPALTDHARIDRAVRSALDRAVELAPLHMPPALAVLDAVTAADPDRPQVACFDTAFHRTMPAEAYRYALPDELVAGGVRRYGFHGLNYEHVVAAVGAEQLGRAVIAHLGNGSSLAAVLDGCSVDTTMGMTPMGGVVMGTRPGDLDPGVVLHLAKADALPGWLEHVLDHRSGLEALSGGHTHDVRTLLDLRDKGDEAASFALAVYARSVAKAIGALATTIGGLDTLVFTGGIGEHAAPVRAEIASRVEHLGVALDLAANATGGGSTGPPPPSPNRMDPPRLPGTFHGVSGARAIGLPEAPVRVLVVAADEELVMAGHAVRLGVPSPRP